MCRRAWGRCLFLFLIFVGMISVIAFSNCNTDLFLSSVSQFDLGIEINIDDTDHLMEMAGLYKGRL